MSAIQKKLLAGGIALVAAVGYLAYAGMKSGWVYFIDVDHFLADPAYHRQRVRLHGKVADEGFVARNLDASFVLLGKSSRLNVAYHGVIPDMFQTGRDVVVEGRLDPHSNTFKADVLMTKCAGKYEPGSPHANRPEASASNTTAANGKESL
ncbi:MAG TPA: cytochrome c maturation protein CcmE [Tepidisphaeraceae bacterium]|nr:cytochrome c maturation protein CcmE [Tepidisphaeraceae bacterium]